MPVVSSVCASPSAAESDFDHQSGGLCNGVYTTFSPSSSPTANCRVKRPMNPFMVWAKEERPRLSQLDPNVHNAELSRRLGQRWREMSDMEKRPYRLVAKRLAVEHKERHPDYKYRPRKKDPAVRRVRGRRIKREEISRAVRSLTREQISAYVGLLDEPSSCSSDCVDTPLQLADDSKTSFIKQPKKIRQQTEPVSDVNSFNWGAVQDCSHVVPGALSTRIRTCAKCPSICACKPVDDMLHNITLENVFLVPAYQQTETSPADVHSQSLIKSEPQSSPELDLVDWLEGLCATNDADADVSTSRWSLCSSSSSSSSSIDNCTSDSVATSGRSSPRCSWSDGAEVHVDLAWL